MTSGAEQFSGRAMRAVAWLALVAVVAPFLVVLFDTGAIEYVPGHTHVRFGVSQGTALPSMSGNRASEGLHGPGVASVFDAGSASSLFAGDLIAVFDSGDLRRAVEGNAPWRRAIISDVAVLIGRTVAPPEIPPEV